MHAELYIAQQNRNARAMRAMCLQNVHINSHGKELHTME